MEWTNRESFCISCHEMRDYLFTEYKRTVHYHNGSGVRATCPDCHVPRDWLHKVERKVMAVNELFHKITGSISSKARFEARREQLGEQVWDEMRQSDSRECRNCHALDTMDPARQSEVAAAQHRKARDQHITCIDCHQGIAHALSEAALDRKHARLKAQGIACRTCHQGMARATDWQ